MTVFLFFRWCIGSRGNAAKRCRYTACRTASGSSSQHGGKVCFMDRIIFLLVK